MTLPPQRAPEAPPYPEDPTAATRHLCAAAYLDDTFRELSLRHVYYQPRRVVAPSYGFDLVPVLGHCLRARNGAIARDAAIVVTFLIAMCVSATAFLSVLTLMVGLQVVVATYRLARDTVLRMRGYSPDNQNALVPRAAMLALGWAAAIVLGSLTSGLLLQRSAGAFLEGGTDQALGLTAATAFGGVLLAGCVFAYPVTFSVWRQSALSGFTPGGPAHLAGAHPPARGDRRSAARQHRRLQRFPDVRRLRHADGPVGARAPAASSRAPRDRTLERDPPTPDHRAPAGVSAAAVRGARGHRLPPPRPERITTVYVHVAVQGRSLYVELSTTALPPCANAYRIVDSVENTGSIAWLRAIGKGLIDTPATIWRSPVALTRAVLNLMIASGGSAAAVRSGRGYDYGATLAVRELAAEEMRNLVQVSDFDKYQGLIERRVIASILDFLDERGVDTAEYRTRAVPSMRIGSINNVGRGGFANFGSIGSNAVYQAPVTIGGPDPAPSSRAEVGVLTVLDQEIKAVVSVLRRMHDYRERRLRHGPLAYEAWLPDRWGRPARVAAVQTREPGNDQAVLAYRGLVEEFRPSVVLLVGIAGGVSPRVRIGDVVVADQVIAYDSRRETPQGPRRRGQAQSISAELGYRLNEFFAALPSPELRRATGSFGLHRGPIGAGNAVVTDANSEIRRWLADFHEKVLAVETESAGVARSFHETAARDNVRGWLAIRGISDTADASKGDAFHDVASAHAAEAMAMLLPYLP